MKRTQPWFVGAALRAISQNVFRTTQVFSERDVAGWDVAFEEKAGMVSIAMERLLHHEMVVRCDPPENARRKLIKLDAHFHAFAAHGMADIIGCRKAHRKHVRRIALA